jgi:hypothetical protein
MSLSKRHVEELSKVYEHLIMDAQYAFSTLRDELEKDLTRLRLLIARRGLHLFCVDLPAVGKHLDRCLDNGEYKLSGLPCSGKCSDRLPIPKLFRGLYLLIFDQKGLLKKDANYEAIFFLRQLYFAAKKVDFPCDVSLIEAEVASFADVDRALPEPSGFWNHMAEIPTDGCAPCATWRSDSTLAGRVSGVDMAKRRTLSSFLTTLDIVSSMVSSTLGQYHPQDWRFKHGPGAISEVTGPTNKYSWRNWSDRLESVFPIADCGFHSWSSWAGMIDSNPDAITSCDPSSRLVSVPKTLTKPRLIAAEPSEHQWCQQNLWHFLRSRTEKTWLGRFIHFQDQARNQALCVRGSKDGSIATVDLSAASDRVTCLVVELMFRSNPGLLRALRSTRTRFVSQNLTRKVPGLVELKKFSTMGSACTFPVQTLIFLSLAIVACLETRKLRPNLRNVLSLADEVSVFGDDICVPTDSRELLFDALELLWFKVNTDKSYWTGRFRESCGVDAFNGVDVTPAFWRAPNSGKPDSMVSTVVVCNNFYSKFLTHTARYLASTIQTARMPYVHMDSGVCGFKTRLSGVPTGVKTRWNADLQRSESLVPTLIAKVKKTSAVDDSGLLQYFTERPEPMTNWSAGVNQRPVLQLKHRWVATTDLSRSG